MNTLFVTTQGVYLSKEGETVVVRAEKETKLRVPIHTLGGIVCFGRVACSPHLIGLCGARNVALSFLSERGQFFGRVVGPVTGNVLLRREQYRRADDQIKASAIARPIVIAKIANCRTSLQRALRDHRDLPAVPEIEKAEAVLAKVLDFLKEPGPLALIRGKEGEAAKIYFGVFDHLVTAQKEDFFFRERNRRPPLDNLNSLLSFLYTLLAHDCVAACESVGLDPAVGFLHRDRPGRPGLALDLMEELRPYLADRLALSLVNRQQVHGTGFARSETGAVMMDDATRKEVLIAYQKRKQEEIHHPFIDEKIAVGLLPYVQVLLLARHLRGDLDGYPPFLWK